MIRELAFVVVGFGVVINSTVEVMAAKNNKQTNAQKNDEKRENQAVQNAQRDVSEAQKKLRDAEKTARQAAEKVKAALLDQQRAASQIQKRRDELEEKHADLVGLTEARRRLDAARKAYEEAGEPILKKLAETDKYKAAIETAKSADRRLADLRDGDAGDSDRLKQMADAAKDKQLPSRLQREALDAEVSLKSERNALKSAEEAVARASDALESAVEKDAGLKSAKDAFEKSKDHVVAARRESEREARDLAEARQKLAREQQDLQQKINADRRDDNKGKNNKKK